MCFRLLCKMQMIHSVLERGNESCSLNFVYAFTVWYGMLVMEVKYGNGEWRAEREREGGI